MKANLKVPKARSETARELANPMYRKRVVSSKKLYSRKGKTSSNKKFEDSIEPVNNSLAH